MKRILPLLLAVLLLAGCSAGGAPVSTTTATTTFPTNRTPAQILKEAVEKTLDATSFALTYTVGQDSLTAKITKDGQGGYRALLEWSCGCSVYVSGKSWTEKDCQTGQITHTTGETAYTMPQIFEDLPRVSPGTVERFGQLRLMASPSSDGTTCFSIGGLSLCQMRQLLMGETCDNHEDDFDGSFALTIDSAGLLVGAEFTNPDPDHPVIYRVVLTQLNQKIEVNKPDWA